MGIIALQYLKEMIINCFYLLNSKEKDMMTIDSYIIIHFFPKIS